jgi:hypothetical protein
VTAPRELFDRHLDGELTSAEFDRLDAWIAAEPAHAAEFLEWAAMQGHIYESLRSDSLQQVLQSSTAAGAASSETAAGSPAAPHVRFPASEGERQSDRLRMPSHRIFSSRVWRFAAAAIFLAVAWGAWDLPGRRDGEAPGDQLAERTESLAGQGDAELGGINIDELSLADADGVVATLTRLERCVWKPSGAPFSYGEQLAVGALISLESGIARITFESGAEALVEGPCEFTVDSAMRGTIRSGRLSVSVPPRAYGFRIRSPDAEVIDLGTEFGVAVDDSGHSEVHVFKGQVLSRQLDAQGQQKGELVRLEANDALRYGAVDGQPSLFSSNEAQFVRQMAAQVPQQARDRLPVHKDLALWLAADLAVHTEGEQRVVAWADILCGDNVTAEDALQADENSRPLLVSDAIGGQPAIHFNGSSSYLVTTPLETTDNQTIFVVCQFSPGAIRGKRSRGGQILNYNGPPHRLLSNTYEPGVLQIGEPIVDGFKPTRLECKRFAGKHEGRDISESIVRSAPIGAHKPVVLAFRYDIDSHRATMWINGEMVGEEPALGPAGIVSRKVIGRHGFMRHHFDGDLAEVLIYNRALSTNRLADVTRYLGERYRIELKPASPAL